MEGKVKKEIILESKYKSVPVQSVTITNNSVCDYLLKKAAENVQNGKTNWMVRYVL
jgi:hypothetical protein